VVAMSALEAVGDVHEGSRSLLLMREIAPHLRTASVFVSKCHTLSFPFRIVPLESSVHAALSIVCEALLEYR